MRDFKHKVGEKEGLLTIDFRGSVISIEDTGKAMKRQEREGMNNGEGKNVSYTR